MVDVATDDSLNHSMNSALKHYSSMFFLPPFRKAIAIVALVCIGGVGLSTFALTFQLSSLSLVDGLVSGLVLGVSVFAAVLLADYVMNKTALRGDPIYVLRRAVALSLFGWVIWLFFVILGVIFGAFFGLWLWVDFCLLGFAAVLTFRAVVFLSTSSAGALQRLFAFLFSPFLCIAPFVVFWVFFDIADPFRFLPFLVISPVVSGVFGRRFW